MILEVFGEVSGPPPCNVVLRDTISHDYIICTAYPSSWSKKDMDHDICFGESTVDCALRTVNLYDSHPDCNVGHANVYIPPFYVSKGQWVEYLVLQVTIQNDVVSLAAPAF